MRYIIYDIEIFKNRFLLGLKCDGKIKLIDDLNIIRKINFEDSRVKFIGYNNRYYDHPILECVKFGYSQEDIYKLSVDIIYKKNRIRSFSKNIIDLFELYPKQGKVSLKEIGHRFQYKILENLPYDYDSELNDNEWEHVKSYNEHDLNITEMLWDKMKPIYDARQNLKLFFNVPVEILGGAANLAQRCILSKLGNNHIVNSYELKKQNNLRLESPYKEFYDECFDISTREYLKGKRPEFMLNNNKYNINGCDLNIQLGGIHGANKSGIYSEVYNYDVTSYYPSIILNCNLGSDSFRNIYQYVYNERLKFKEQNSQYQESLKLILNSIFGKFNDHKFSDERIYAPNLSLTICLLGQFYIIDLLLKLKNNPCLIVNTDGIFCKNPIDETVLNEWKQRTGFKLSYKKYKLMLIKDVNNCYGIDENKNEYRKGEFLLPSWLNSAKAPIIHKAAINYLLRGIKLNETIRGSKNMFDFCFFKKAKQGHQLLFDGKPLKDPKIRFYASTDGKVLEHITDLRTSKIIKNSNVSLLMNVEQRNNINYGWYEQQSKNLINRIIKND